jgi:hypothetical protein
MHHRRLSRMQLGLIVSLTPLMLSGRSAWTQEAPPANKTPNQVSILAAPFAEGPEAGLRIRPVYENLSPPLAPNKEQTPPSLRFRSFDPGYHSSFVKNNALPDLWQLAKIEEPQVKANYFIGNAPTEWLTNDIPHHTLHYRAPDPEDDLQYYGHHIPWAGRIILGMSSQAKFHPRVVRVLELVGPGLSLEKPPRTRWIGK